MKYIQQLLVQPHIAEDLEKCCDEIVTDVSKDGVEFDQEVVFSNGMRMAVQVCGPGDPTNESCWTQGILFDPHGNECGYTDCGESFLGEYYVFYNDDEYITEVIVDERLR